MKKFASIIFLFILFLLASCTQQSKIKQAIKDWELINNSLQIKSIVLIDTLAPYYAKDSIVVLQTNLDAFIAEKNLQLSRQLDEVNIRIAKTQKKIDSTENDLMKKAINQRIYELEKLKKRHLHILDIYKNNDEITQVGVLRKQISSYQSMPDKVLGYVVKAKIIGEIGNIAIDKERKYYLLKPYSNRVIAEVR